MKLRKAYFLLLGLLLMLTSPLAFAGDDGDIAEMMDLSLDELLDYEMAGRGDIGSFGYRLKDTMAEITLHGYVTNNFSAQEGNVSTFDQHYFNLFVSGRLMKNVFAEIQLEYEHGGSEIQARYAQIDVEVNPSLIIRSGKFLIPTGPFNEYLYPDFITKAVNRPFANREISPTSWADVGVQVRGKVDAGDWQPSYAVYIVNGLEGMEGDRIRGMRGAGGFRDKNNSNKAVGGHLGMTYKGVEAGGSVYHGAYTPDGMFDLTIYSFDLSYTTPTWGVRGEFQGADEEITGGSINKTGFYVLANTIISENWEPIVRYDQINEGIAGSPERDKQRWTFGVNYIFSQYMKLKANYEFIEDDGADQADNTFGLQFVLAF